MFGEPEILLVAPEPTAPGPRRPRGVFRLLGRHQAAALVATAFDFTAMIVAVELGHTTPVAATALGATCGAVVNFLINRHWTFAASHRGLSPQALRYFVVSATSLGLQVLGEWLVYGVLGANYVLARLVTAVLTSLLWNFPMQRYFVFRA